jgi:pimeloyl-ACP methyl ester carboxylesterase
MELDCARIHYVDEGAGESLLLLHGNPSWCFLYRKIYEHILVSQEPGP